MGKTEELLQIGALVDEIPEPGKRWQIPVMFTIQRITKFITNEDKPLTPEERITQLEQALLELTMLLGGGN